MYGISKNYGVVSPVPTMKPAISMGLMLLLASCAAPEQHTGIHARNTVPRSHDTLQPRLVAVPGGPDHSTRKGHAGYALNGEFRSYGLAEEPPPIASIEAPHASYQSPVPPRRVINQVTNETSES